MSTRLSNQTHAALLLMVIPLLMLTACAALWKPRLSGRVDGKTYIAPGGTFSCPVVNLGSNTEISDSVLRDGTNVLGGMVRFMSLFGLSRLDYQKTTNSSLSLQQELDAMLSTQLEWYRRIPSPDAYVLHQETTNESLFAVLIAPKGHLGALNGYGEHPDLRRAILIFKRGDFVYAVSTDHSGPGDMRDKSPKQLDVMRKIVSEFATTITFK